MTIAPGSRLGPYEVISLLGAGGMGEVYRARDTRLGREVAVKVLPPAFSADPERLRRFEIEARAASALNHPNIVTVHDFSTQDGSPYVVSELLEGETLRQRLVSGKLSVRRAVEYSLEIARGLAAAHEKGIVHRDLKPENVFVTRDGRVKILDFGLAKLLAPLTPPEAGGEAPTVPNRTDPGIVMGTVSYMSPEQVQGRPADHRSDIFSFGSVFYEMLSGQRAFRRDSMIETMSAILKEDPPEISGMGKAFPLGIDRVLRHCLEKSPERRFQSASDLAFELEALSGLSATSSPAMTLARPRLRSRPGLLAVALGAGALAFLAYVAGLARGRTPMPTFRQLTFRRGTILTARFARDGDTVLYGAAWDGSPFRIFTTRPESPESAALPLPDADLLSISPSGELAVSLSRRFSFGWMTRGTLARMPFAGGSPREVLEQVQEADWSPDGTDLAVVRRVGVRQHLEFPIGKTLYETAGWISHPRVSPDGSRVAFLDHPIYADDRGSLAVVDRRGRRTTLSGEWASALGLAWSASGREVWFTASGQGLNSTLHAATLSGKVREIASAAGRLTLLDVSRQGRALVSRDQSRLRILGLAPGERQERDLSWLDNSGTVDLSDDGTRLLFTESGDGGGPTYSVYLRSTDGSPPTRLGEGQGTALSPDGKWALSILFRNPTELRMLPTGPGEARVVPRGSIERYHWALWLPDGRTLLFTGNETGKPFRIYSQDPAEAKPHPITPEGIGYLLAPTPNGKFVVSTNVEGQVMLYPVAGGPPRPLEGLEPGEEPLRWSRDGRFLFVRRRGGIPVQIDRLNLSTGRREPWAELAPADRAGVISISAVFLSSDGRSHAYTYQRLLSELYLVEGLK